MLNLGGITEDIPLDVIDVMLGNSTDIVSNCETATEGIPLREADLVFVDSGRMWHSILQWSRKEGSLEVWASC
jgi:hypothetical protein